MRSDNSAVIVAAKRTAIGSFGGTLATTPAHKLGSACIKAIIKDSGIDPEIIDEVIVGQILTAGEGQNPARQAAIHAGIPHKVPSISINKLCGSGMKAVHYAAQAIALGDSQIIIAGGQENMSLAPHLLPKSRIGQRMGDWQMVDSMINDALSCAFNHYHMGVTAENIAKKFAITREQQDAFALASQHKASNAQKKGFFNDEIIEISIPQRHRDPIVFDKDEFIRHDLTIEKLVAMRPAFSKEEGSVTAGNASGINDGAAMLMVTSQAKAEQLGLEPLARIVSWASAGVDPAIMGTGPIPATRKCLNKAGWSIDQLDLIESNEAFAVQSLAVSQELDWDTSKVNVNGGAIALGHPVGASGARILTSLIHQMKRSDAKKGLATMCIGGGQGIAISIERE